MWLSVDWVWHPVISLERITHWKKNLSDIFEWTVAMLLSLSPWHECPIKYYFGNYLVGIRHKPEFAKDRLLKEPKESNYLENQLMKFSFIVCVKPSHPTGIVTVVCILILPKGKMQSCQFNSLRLVFVMLPNQLRIKNPHWACFGFVKQEIQMTQKELLTQSYVAR